MPNLSEVMNVVNGEVQEVHVTASLLGLKTLPQLACPKLKTQTETVSCQVSQNYCKHEIQNQKRKNRDKCQSLLV